MSKKIAVIFVITMSMLQFVLLAYFNFRYVTYDVYHTLIPSNYIWFVFVQLCLDEVVIFSIGYIIYFKEEIMKNKAVMVSSIVLFISCILLVFSGLYYSIFYDMLANGLHKAYNACLNIFYVFFGVTLLVFIIFIFRSKLFDNLPKLLLILMFSLVVVKYFYSSLQHGWFHGLLNDTLYPRPIRYMISSILMYPLYVSMYVVSALYLFKSSKIESS